MSSAKGQRERFDSYTLKTCPGSWSATLNIETLSSRTSQRKPLTPYQINLYS